MNTNLFMDLLSYLAIILPAFLLVFTIRGFSKALVAKTMGDDTAWHSGFLSLNPLVHINFLGMFLALFILIIVGGLLLQDVPRSILFVFLIILGIRWINPVPVNESNFKNYSLGVILTTLAGSIGSFILALIFLYVLKYFPFKFLPIYAFITLGEIFGAIIELAIFFCVLDLIPIPPFDGGRLLEFILPRKWGHIISWLYDYSVYIFLALFILPGISDLFFYILYRLSFFIKIILLHLVF